MDNRKNILYYGDNLAVMREYLPDESVDLIYLDPPFNSNRNYNVLFREESGEDSQAQITAFEDTWHWDDSARETYHELIKNAPENVSRMIGAFHDFIGRNQMMAYILMMTVRLIELKRILKETGSLYLHCDPTASHYLKIVLDTIFGAENFKNEIIWHYRRWTNTQAQFQSMHDVILFYSKSQKNVFHPTEVEMSDSQQKKFERGWDSNVIHTKDGRYSQLIVYDKEKLEQAVRLKKINLDKFRNIVYRDKAMVAASDVIILPVLNSQAGERMGYPTQKPLALLEKIVQASSNEGDIVFDPFCGCGTAIAASQKLGRRWIGIDITHLAVALQKYRLKENFGLIEKKDYQVIGEPEDLPSAEQLSKDDRYQFQWWALSLIQAKPVGHDVSGRKGKKGKDRGIDGVISFIDDSSEKAKRVIVQVKSGHVGVKDIRDLIGVLDREKAAIGVFITLKHPSKDMKQEAGDAGYYESEGFNKKYPKVQLLTIEELFDGATVNMPPIYNGFKNIIGNPSFQNGIWQR